MKLLTKRPLKFEVFNLMNTTSKISNFVQERQDGLIIILTDMNEQISNQIKNLV
mgnify:CR=1 FL=1